MAQRYQCCIWSISCVPQHRRSLTAFDTAPSGVACAHQRTLRRTLQMPGTRSALEYVELFQLPSVPMLPPTREASLHTDSQSSQGTEQGDLPGGNGECDEEKKALFGEPKDELADDEREWCGSNKVTGGGMCVWSSRSRIRVSSLAIVSRIICVRVFPLPSSYSQFSVFLARIHCWQAGLAPSQRCKSTVSPAQVRRAQLLTIFRFLHRRHAFPRCSVP